MSSCQDVKMSSWWVINEVRWRTITMFKMMNEYDVYVDATMPHDYNYDMMICDVLWI
jgi:hypothetical protein